MSSELLTVHDVLVAMTQNVGVFRRVLGADFLQHDPHPIDNAFEVFATEFNIMNLLPLDSRRVVISLFEEFAHEQDSLTTCHARAKALHFLVLKVEALPNRRVVTY